MPRNCESYRQYIERVEELLISDLREAYPDAKTSETDAIGDILEEIFQQYHGEKFIFVLDEWDFIFHRGFITEADKAKYVAFLSNLLKDRPYVILSYMTGILPIAKYSSGSELNMFAEKVCETGITVIIQNRESGYTIHAPLFLHYSLTIWQITGPAQVHMMKFIITFEIMYPTSGMTLH